MHDETKVNPVAKLLGIVPAILACGILTLFSIIFLLLLVNEFPASNKDIIMGLADTLKNIMFVSFGYYLNSTHTSDKAAILKTTVETANMQNTLPVLNIPTSSSSSDKETK